MGASWNPHGGVVTSEKKLSQQEVSQLKGEWLTQLTIPANSVVKLWNKFKMVLLLFSPLK
jgi:hypothetical protein